MESSPLIAAVSGGNSTVSGGSEVVLDLTAVDPDEVLYKCSRYLLATGALNTTKSLFCERKQLDIHKSEEPPHLPCHNVDLQSPPPLYVRRTGPVRSAFTQSSASEPQSAQIVI